MFQRQGMILKGCMAVGHGRVAGVAGFRRKTEIRHVQAPQLETRRFRPAGRQVLRMPGMQRQQEKKHQAGSDEQQKLQ